MKVIIVAAGMGRRLMPLTKDYPKCLLEVGGHKIIDFTLSVLDKMGLDDIVIVVGHKQEKIRQYLGSKAKFVVNPSYQKTNSMYSLWCAKDYFGEEFLYLHSDIIFEKSILEEILSSKHEICLCVDEKDVNEEDMKVRIENGKIAEINKSILLEKAAGEFIGIAKFTAGGTTGLKQALNVLVKDENNRDAYFEYAIEYLSKQKYDVYPCLTSNMYYAEVDCEADIHRISVDLTKKMVL